MADLHELAGAISGSSPNIKAFAVAVADVLQPPPSPSGAAFRYTGGDFDAWLRTLKGGTSSAYIVAAIAASAHISHPIKGSDGYPSYVHLIADNPASPPTITGKIDTRGDVSDWVVEGVNLDDSLTPFAPGTTNSWVVGSTRFIFRRCTATNGNTKIAFEFIDSSIYGHAVDSGLDRCDVHHFGRMLTTRPDPTSYPAAAQGSDGLWRTNNDHGIYLYGLRTFVRDTAFRHGADRGIQDRGGKGSVYESFLVEYCGEGILFGDGGAASCHATKGILRNNMVASRHLIETYGSNTANTLDDCFAYNDDGRSPLGSHAGLTVTNLHMTPPPAAGYGPRYPVGAAT